jgi:hypothetical protein
MKTIKQILAWLSGKKSIIAGLITTTSAFLALEGVISAELATYINAVSLILFGSASIATGKIVYNK